MRRALFVLALLAFSVLAGDAIAQPLTSLPTGKGLPVAVKAAVSFVEIVSFNENAGTFKATVDVRLRWQDLRLRRPEVEATAPPRVYRGVEAQVLRSLLL